MPNTKRSVLWDYPSHPEEGMRTGQRKMTRQEVHAFIDEWWLMGGAMNMSFCSNGQPLKGRHIHRDNQREVRNPTPAQHPEPKRERQLP